MGWLLDACELPWVVPHIAAAINNPGGRLLEGGDSSRHHCHPPLCQASRADLSDRCEADATDVQAQTQAIGTACTGDKYRMCRHRHSRCEPDVMQMRQMCKHRHKRQVQHVQATGTRCVGTDAGDARQMRSRSDSCRNVADVLPGPKPVMRWCDGWMGTAARKIPKPSN